MSNDPKKSDGAQGGPVIYGGSIPSLADIMGVDSGFHFVRVLPPDDARKLSAALGDGDGVIDDSTGYSGVALKQPVPPFRLTGIESDGTVLRIRGEHFSDAHVPLVTVGGVAVRARRESATLITCRLPLLARGCHRVDVTIGEETAWRPYMHA